MTLVAQGRTAQEKILWMSWFTPGVHQDRRGLPYVLVGYPGTAKTSIVGQLARLGGLHFEGVVSSLRAPTDFIGLPVPKRIALTEATQFLSPEGDAEALLMEYAPAAFAVRAAAAKRSVLLLDEVNTTPPAVQAALLRLLFEGVCGELKLPQGVRMALAMNHSQDAAGGWDIAAPLANRIGWLDWAPPSATAFAEFLVTRGTPSGPPVNAKAEEAAVDAAWGPAWAGAAGQVAGFINRRPELLHKMPKSGSKEQSEAWPSHRTWDLAAHALAGSSIYGLDQMTTMQAAAAFIGTDAYKEFYAWVKAADLPDPEKLLDGQVKFTHAPARLDRTAAVLASCSALLADENLPKRKPRAEAMWSMLYELSDQVVSIALPSLVAMTRSKQLLTGSNMAFKTLAKFEPVMNAAGLSAVRG